MVFYEMGQLAHDNEVLGLNPATAKLFSGDSNILALWTNITESTERRIRLRCKVFDISALIGQNIMLKSK